MLGLEWRNAEIAESRGIDPVTAPVSTGPFFPLWLHNNTSCDIRAHGVNTAEYVEYLHSWASQAGYIKCWSLTQVTHGFDCITLSSITQWVVSSSDPRSDWEPPRLFLVWKEPAGIRLKGSKGNNQRQPNNLVPKVALWWTDASSSGTDVPYK